MTIVRRLAGPADNAGVYKKWIRSDASFQSLFLSSVDKAPMSDNFDDDLVPTVAYPAWYGYNLVVHPGNTAHQASLTTNDGNTLEVWTSFAAEVVDDRTPEEVKADLKR
ncbi:hypothetical protein WA026_019017 [Henosepilachna vigintioctopunctata]|uniref:Uncharacterized protein n=1 Tax=Henosepilachna vigintioctopunctata TaxID=420089 RepID=A0AAW1VEV9_9CUCU